MLDQNPGARRAERELVITRVFDAPRSMFVYLDITPKGRNETEIMDWVKRHDEYGADAQSCGHAAKSA